MKMTLSKSKLLLELVNCYCLDVSSPQNFWQSLSFYGFCPQRVCFFQHVKLLNYKSVALGQNNCLLKLISQFLTRFARDNGDAPQMLTEALVIAIDEIVNCSHSSELQELDPRDVGLFILDLTKPGTNKYTDVRTQQF
jgi:hypothetical protein